MLEKGVEVQILGTDSVLTKTPNLVGQIAIKDPLNELLSFIPKKKTRDCLWTPPLFIFQRFSFQRQNK